MNLTRVSFSSSIISVITAVSIFAISCSQEDIQKTYTVGGTITGITGDSTTIAINGDDPLVLNTDGSFSFETRLFNTESYAVTVTNQPTYPLECQVTDGSGIITGSEVDDILVQCVEQYYWSVSGDFTVAEGNSASYTISLSGALLPPGETASVQISTQNGSSPSAAEGIDYFSIDGYTITITGPATSATFNVDTVPDSETEDPEHYQVEILNPGRGTISSGESIVETTIID